MSGQSTTVTANAYDTDGLTGINIYVNGVPAQGCQVSGNATSGTCTVSLYAGSYSNYSTVSVYAQAIDRYGNAATSSTSTLTVNGSNANTNTNTGNGSVSLSLSPNSTTLINGQTTTVTASAYRGRRPLQC